MDVWILGDIFLNDVFATMQTLKMTVAMEKRNPPYLYDQYNVFYFFTPRNNQLTNILMRVRNSIAEAFNRRYHMPRYIVIMLDKDVVESLNYFDPGETKLLGQVMDWISKEVQHCMEARCEDLYRTKAGAAYPGTKVVWVKMIPRKGKSTNYTNQELNILDSRQKFNNILDDIAERKKQNHVMNIISLEDAHFDQFGSLNYQGKIQYWKELDFLIKKFDRKEITLSPSETLHAK